MDRHVRVAAVRAPGVGLHLRPRSIVEEVVRELPELVLGGRHLRKVGVVGAECLDTHLVKLTEAALLCPLVAEIGAGVPDLP